jgi:hypothetical protein
LNARAEESDSIEAALCSPENFGVGELRGSVAKETEPTITKIGKYAVIDVIGAGGMGIVYRARDAALNRTVAIKMLRRSGASDAQSSQVAKFFNRELLATASLQHKNIVTVYESGEEAGDPYLVMECLEGEPVSRIVSERRPMPLVDKLDILIQVCDGLQYAHDRSPQVIHRDIKPANVILLKDGTAKLVDFGIARIAGSETAVTQTGQLVGSLSYMSPEQINSLPIDARTDIFSAGVLAYELIAYTLPFKGNDPGSTFVKILREDPEPLRNYVPDIPPDLEAAVYRALAKKAQDRYQTAEEFGFDLLSVQRKLKQGMTAEYLQRAEAAMERGEWERAKQQLLEITRLDRHHERANRLLAEVRKTIQNKERAAQVIQMRSQAQVALAGQQYDEALACVEQAVQLDPQDAASLALREEIKNIVSLNKSVRETLGRAESAMLAGDLDDAKLAVQQVLSFKPDSAEARALATMIENELAERSRRAQVQNLVDSAREGISKRQFEDAIQSLRRAEELDPTDSNVRELMQWATRGKEQELRRKELLDLTGEIDRALRTEDFSSAFTICELALGKFPDEQTLLRLRGIAEKQKGIAERRRFVQDQSLAAREMIEAGDLEGAISLLDSGLVKIPAEPNFEALLAQARKALQDRNTNTQKAVTDQAAADAKELYRRRAREEGASLQKALDEREQVEFLKVLATNLSEMLKSMEADEQTRRICDPLIEQVRLRVEGKQQLLTELSDLRKALSQSSDAALRTKASGRVVEAKAAFPRERDVRSACDEISKSIESVREDRTRVTGELSKIADELGRVRFEEARELMSRANLMASPYQSEPQVGALLQQIHFEVERRQKRLESRIREIANLENAISEASSLESISQLQQNAISISSPEAEEPSIASAVESVRRAGDKRRRAISDSLGQIEEITNRALAARSVDDAERLMEEAKSKALAFPNIDEIQRNLVRVAAQIRGRRVEHDLVQGELEALAKSAHDNASTSELEAIKRRAAEVHDKYPNERTLITLCKQLDSEVDTAKDKFLQVEIARVREEERRWSAQQSVEPQVLASSLRRLEDLVQAYPDNVELRSALLKAQEALNRADRAQRDTASRMTLRRTGIDVLPQPLEESPKSSRRLVVGVVSVVAVIGAVIVGWVTLHRSSNGSFTLTIETSPTEAAIEVNGQPCTSHPCTYALPPNTNFEVTANLDGYASAQKTGTLTKNDKIVIALSKVEQPPPVRQGGSTPASVEVRHPGRLVVAGLHPTDKLFVDDTQMSRPDSSGGWSIDAGLHRLRLMDGNQELLTGPRQVRSDATLTLSRSDFKVPAPLTSEEQVAWDRAAKSQDIATINAFLTKYPNSSRREQADSELESLYWQRASSTGTAAAFHDFLNRYPSGQGAHYGSAIAAIDKLDWQGLSNSTDVSQISAFLARHPGGPYHTLAAERLDDLAWIAAKASGNADAIRSYQREYPDGRHRDDASTAIAQLTPKPSQTRQPDTSAIHNPPSSTEHAENDPAAIRRVLDAYQDAYESRSLEKLRAIWPTMTSSQADNLGRLLKGANQIQAPYSILKQDISGDDAKVSIQQFLAVGGQKPHTAKMTVLLKKKAGGSSWYINAIQ